MPTIILDVSTAMSTFRNRQANTVKGLRYSLRKIKQSVMSRIQLLSPWEGSLHGESNPMPKGHS